MIVLHPLPSLSSVSVLVDHVAVQPRWDQALHRSPFPHRVFVLHPAVLERTTFRIHTPALE